MRFLLAASLLSTALFAACAWLPDQMVGHSPAAIRDAYLIDHGMAESYSERPDADPQVLAQLQTLDQHAAAAVGAMATTGSFNPDDTARAVAALTDYAAQQTAVLP